MDQTHLMIVASTLLLGHSVFFAAYLFLDRRNSRYRLIRFLLAFVLLAFALRIIKSVIYIIFPEYANPLTSIGIVGMLALGPLHWFYVQAVLNNGSVKYVHFIPALLVFLGIPWLAHNEFQIFEHRILKLVYAFSLMHMLFYLLMSGRAFTRMGLLVSRPKNKNAVWFLTIITSIFLLWVAFLLQAVVVNKTIYVWITVCEVVVFYTVTLIIMKNYSHATKPLISASTEYPQLEKLAKAAVEALKEDNLFTKNDLTITFLAKKLESTSHMLSKALNNVIQMSFPELLVSLRIEYALELLKDIKLRNLSIESVAFESGFNSVSVFYQNFKKHSDLTPAEFRKKYAQVEDGQKGR